MSRFINQINVSITTNRTCNLRCKHCYIQPELFSDKTQISKDNFKLIFDRVQQLYERDSNLTEVEWEIIGGETTLMPYEFWEDMLPWALDRVAEFNKQLAIPGKLNFITNLIFADERYIDLINRYADHPAFALYTSWEPDTNRFGRNNKLLPRFQETLSKINCEDITLDIIMTKAVMDIGARDILETFVPLGVTDFSCKMLSPYGSGKDFFDGNMASFDEMTLFLDDMRKHRPPHVRFTPDDEMRSSLYRGTSFQCNGNFLYDLSIEPDGRTTFNANQTGSEAAVDSRAILLTDDDWVERVILANTTEENNKLTLKHAACDTCEYLSYCNAGWYHYKLLPQEVLSKYNEKECPGLKGYWDIVKQDMGHTADIRQRNQMRSTRHELVGRMVSARHKWGTKESSIGRRLVESEISQSELLQLARSGKLYHVVINEHDMFGHTLAERLWFYDALRWMVTVESGAITPQAEDSVYHSINEHFQSAGLSVANVQQFIKAAPDSAIAWRLVEVISMVKGFLSTQQAPNEDVPLHVAEDMMIRWAMKFYNEFPEVLPTPVSEADYRYLAEASSLSGGLRGKTA